MKILSVISILLATAAAFSTSAATESISCNGCDTLGMQSKASLSQKRIGSSYVIVFNYEEGVAYKYYRSLRFGNRGEPIRSATKVELSQSETYDAELILSFQEDTLNSMQNFDSYIFESEYSATDYSNYNKYSSSNSKSSSGPNFRVADFDVKGDPYNFLSNSRFRNNAFDYYYSAKLSGYQEFLGSFLNTMKIPTGLDMGLYLDINFYSDVNKETPTGTIRATLDFEKKQFKSISARDAEGNSIPLKLDELSGEYEFSNKVMGEETFLNYISLMFESSSTTNCVVTSRRVNGNNYIYTYSCS